MALESKPLSAIPVGPHICQKLLTALLYLTFLELTNLTYAALTKELSEVAGDNNKI